METLILIPPQLLDFQVSGNQMLRPRSVGPTGDGDKLKRSLFPKTIMTAFSYSFHRSGEISRLLQEAPGSSVFMVEQFK